MKAKKLILGLAMTIVMGLGATAYAATDVSETSNADTTTSSTSTYNRVGFGRMMGMRGYDYVEAVLKDKLGMTDEEITAGLNSGKTMYDLAEEKGITADEFKEALLEERNKAIDNAVSNGDITSEEAASLKEDIKNNMNNYTGVPGQRAGKGLGMGTRGNGHMSGNGAIGLSNCYFNNSVE